MVNAAADPPTPTVAATSDRRWPSSVAGRKILDQYGNVHPLKVFSAWGMTQNLTDAEITEALEGVAARGFNAVNVAPNGVGVQADWVKYENVAGDPFFATTAGGRTSTRPFTGELGAAWSSMDWVIEEAERLGMTVVVSFFVSYGTSGIGPELTAATNTDAENYGSELATRYLDAPNLVWHVEADTGWSAGDPIGRRLDNLFKGITETETTPRLVIAEPYLGGTGYGMFIDQEGTDPTGYEWLLLSTNALYSYEDNSVEEFDDVWNQTGATSYPVWDSEPPYAGAIDKYGGNFRQQLRERNYAVFIRGGCGINYGDEDYWRFGKLGFYDGGLEWFEVPDAAPTIEAQYAWTVLDKYVADPTWDPDGGTFVKTGLGSGDTKAASGFSGTAALAYFPSSRSIVVDTTILSGTPNVRLQVVRPDRRHL